MYPPAQAFTSLAPAHGQAFGTNPPPFPGYGGTSPSWDCSEVGHGELTVKKLGDVLQKSGARGSENDVVHI
jgi:hypothetical protein